MSALVFFGVAGWLMAGVMLWRVRQPRRDPGREAYIRDLKSALRLSINFLLRLEEKQRPIGASEIVEKAEALLFKE
jgi:hypothetical protein